MDRPLFVFVVGAGLLAAGVAGITSVFSARIAGISTGITRIVTHRLPGRGKGLDDGF